MNQTAQCDWLPQRARWSHLARSGLPAASHKKNYPKSHIINPLLTKFARSRWLDIGLILFCEFMGPPQLHIYSIVTWKFHYKTKSCQGNFKAALFMVASWLLCSNPEWAVRVQVLAGDIVLCSLARHFNLRVPLSTQMYKWVPANLMLGVTLRWTSIPSRGE